MTSKEASNELKVVTHVMKEEEGVTLSVPDDARPEIVGFNVIAGAHSVLPIRQGRSEIWGSAAQDVWSVASSRRETDTI